MIISCVSKSKLNSIENIVSAELIDSDINHNEFTLVINKVYKYFRLNKNRTKDDQLGDTERDKFLKRRAERIGKKKKRERETKSETKAQV